MKHASYRGVMQLLDINYTTGTHEGRNTCHESSCGISCHLDELAFAYIHGIYYHGKAFGSQQEKLFQIAVKYVDCPFCKVILDGAFEGINLIGRIKWSS